MFTGLDHLDICVENFQETVDFLTGIGFEVIRQMGERGTVEIRFPGGPDQPFIELRPCIDANGKVRPAGLRHIALRTDDFEGTYNQLKDQGYKFRNEPHYVESSGRTVVGLMDPNGQQLQFVSPPKE